MHDHGHTPGHNTAPEKVPRPLIDGHSHIGEMQAWKFYDLAEPVKPTVYEFAGTKEYLDHLDSYGIERALVIAHYGVPVQEQPFSLNPLVLDSVSGSDRLCGALWVSFLPQNRELTFEALKHAGEERIAALKTTFLLGGNPNPEGWDEATTEVAEACFDAAERHASSSTSTPARAAPLTSPTSSRWWSATASR